MDGFCDESTNSDLLNMLPISGCNTIVVYIAHYSLSVLVAILQALFCLNKLECDQCTGLQIGAL